MSGQSGTRTLGLLFVRQALYSSELIDQATAREGFEPSFAAQCRCLCPLDDLANPQAFGLQTEGRGKVDHCNNQPKWTWRDSNPRLPRCERGALPTELQALVSAWILGLDLPLPPRAKPQAADSAKLGCFPP